MSIRKIFLLSSTMFLAACASDDLFVTHTGNMPSEDKIAMVFKGQSKKDVWEILGSPSTIVPLDKDTWVYMSSEIKQVAFMPPEEIERDVLVVKFDENDNVSSIEKLDKNQGENLEVAQEQTQNTEKKEGFFRKYFGGVGQYLPFGNSGGGMEP